MAAILPYGSWPSPLSAAAVVEAQIGLSQPGLAGGHAFWVESRPGEGGRATLIRRDAGGRRVELTPAPFNLRSLVHEYGGRAWTAVDGIVLGVDFASQRLHRLQDGVSPRPITPESRRALRFADFEPDPARGRVIAVREDHRSVGAPVNEIVAIAIDGHDDPGRILAGGHDFVAYPRLSPDGGRLAWIGWDHPDMPWDATRLWSAEIARDGSLRNRRCVAGDGASESILQPAFAPDGRLHFVSDRSGFWNIHREEADGRITPLCPREAEFAGPLWQLGASWYGFLDAEELLCCVGRDGMWQLARLDAAKARLSPMDLPWTEFSGLICKDGRTIVAAAAPDRAHAVLQLDPKADSVEELVRGGEVPLAAEAIARPRPIRFTTDDGASGHAFYYPPTNPEAVGPADARPPLIVRSHGGPTGAASSALRLGYQYWTSRGFAIVDVNYGGSTGFGRAYRKRLEGRWGVVDVSDCVAAVRDLVARGLADPDRVAISGGSAGGYTTLCALTFTEVFKAGASHYGIGDLTMLARDTHKFESRYLDRLVGPWPAAEELYRARSPIHHVERLSCPVILFQGEEDTIVPPNQARAMAAALRAKGLPVACLIFPGEPHGFRRAETMTRVLEAEFAFFCRVFKITPAGELPPIPLENAPDR